MKDKFINKIDKELISQLQSGDSSLADAFLEMEGYDISIINNLANQSFKKQSFILKGLINVEKDNLLLERASQFFQDAINKNIEKPINYLKTLILNNQFAIQYRNLENLDIDEIKEIIKDQNLLEILEELENEKEQ